MASLSSLKSKATSAASKIKSTASSAASKVKSTATSARTTASSAASKVKSTVSSLKSTATSATSKVKSTASNLKTAASSAINRVKTATSTAKSTASKAATTLKSATSKVTNLGTTVKNTSSSTLSNLKSKTSNLGTTVKNTVTNGTSTLKNLANKITSSASTKTSSLTNAFKTLTTKASGNNVLSSISSAIKESKTGGIGSLTNLVNKYAGKGTTSISNTFSTIKNNITSKTTSIKNGLLTSLNSVFSNNSRINISNAINTLRNSLSGKSTSSALSGLFNQAKNLKSNIGSISPLNVFSGLTSKITSAKANLQNTLSTVTSIDTMGVLGLSTTLGGISQRVQDSFNNWKSKLGSLIGADSMSGIIESSSETASGKMTGLFSQFREYAQNMSNRLFGISEEAAGVDDGYYAPEAEEGSNVLGARDAGVTEDIGTMSSSSGYDDGPGVAGAVSDLGLEYGSTTDLAKQVMDGKYGTGQARKDALGDRYDEVQAEVNNYLKTGKWSDSGSSSKSSGTGSASKQDASTNTGSDSKSKSVSGESGSTAKKTTTTGGKTTKLTSKSDVSNFVANDVPEEERKNGDSINAACAKYARLRADYYYQEKYGDEQVFSKAHPVSSTSYPGYYENKAGYDVSHTPQEGAIIVFDGHNHSGFVESVNDDGTITISESNWGVSRGKHEYNVRTITPSSSDYYITYDPSELQ